ncbi:MAG: ATPase [Rhodobacteraceae bacterium]|nr:ATPase [Paracoccaceae bacterium]
MPVNSNFRSVSRENVQVVVRASISTSPDARAVKRVFAVVGTNSTAIASPNTAAATARHTATSIPCQTPLAIDKVTHQFDEVVNLLAEYGETDLLCYRADAPVELTQRQAQAWDPLLSWAKDTLGADLSPANGVMFVEQPARSLNHLKTVLLDQSAFQLTATYDLISISGSLILGLAVCKGKISAQEAWDLSRIDEIWQIEQWGEDEEATEVAEIKANSMRHAERFFAISS